MAKVVAAIWGTTILHQGTIWRIGWIHSFLHIILVQFILFFISSWCKISSAARNWINSVPQIAATTFALSSTPWADRMAPPVMQAWVWGAVWRDPCAPGARGEVRQLHPAPAHPLPAGAAKGAPPVPVHRVGLLRGTRQGTSSAF